jgi:uncharacterized protein YcaQ
VPPLSLSLDDARALALTAQGFADARPRATPGRRELRRVLDRVGLIQIDSVNVLVRSHYLPLYSRLGAYPPALLDDAAYGPERELFEYWGHEASLVPLASHPLLRWRMERAKRRSGTYRRMAELARDKPDFVRELHKTIERRGPTCASELEGGKGIGSWWGWSEVKIGLEYLFWCGEITTAARRNFERVYDLTERVLPRAVIDAPTPDDAAAQRGLIEIAARALGVATERDLRDYSRLDTDDARARIAELVESGALVTASVEGWQKAAYVQPRRARVRLREARALLSPFDSLVWNRPRTERLFGFDYRLEIYVPRHKRVHGYYVLPYLYEGRLSARVDLKSDRRARTLIVHATHLEPHAGRDVVAALREDLAALAAWLGLERVREARRPSRIAAR